MRTNFFITALTLFLSFGLNAQEDIISANADSESGIKSNTRQINISPDLYFLQGDDENMGVYLGKEGVFLVDTQNEEEMSRSIRLINRLSNKKPIDYLVNTSGKAKYYKTYGDLKKKGTIILSNQPKFGKEDKQKEKNSTSSISNITYSSEIIFNYVNEKIKLIPINNSGNTIVYFTKRNVLFTGDSFLGRKYPLIDSEKGNSFEDIKKAVSEIKRTADNKTKIIPGKGDITNLTDVTSTLLMLDMTYKRVYSYRENGKTLEQVLAMDTTRNSDKQGFGNGPITSEMFITSLYNEIAKKIGPLETRTPQEKANDRLKEMEKEKENKN